MARDIVVKRFDAERYKGTIGQFIREETYKLAMKKLSEARAKGFDQKPVVITDRVPRKDPRSVKLFGRIEFVARPQMANVVLFALEELKRRSPLGPPPRGHYRDDHVVMVNGRVISGSVRGSLAAIKPGDRVQIVNPRIYARKLEPQSFKDNKKTGRQRTKRRASSRQAPQGVYRTVLRELVGKYSKSMFFDFTFVKLNTGVKVWGDEGGRYRKDGSRTFVRRVQRDQVYPCLNFFIKEEPNTK